MIWRCDLEKQAAVYEARILPIMATVAKTGRYCLGPVLEKFERAFASYVGTEHCVGVANATDGLMLALKVAGVQPGDEVITTPFTAIPTVSAIVAVGGRPVFVDIDRDTYLIDIQKIPSAITEKTKAIMPVHLFAQMVDVPKLRTLISDDLIIIEDAAQAHGMQLNGNMAGTVGDLAAFSFYPTKNLGGYGDGGAVVTNNPEFDKKLRLMRNYGKESADTIILDGVNSRLDVLQAACLMEKLPDLESMNEHRRRIADVYREQFIGLPIEVPYIQPNTIPNYHVYVVKVLEKRDELKSYLQENGVQTDIFYPYPHHLQPAYAHLGYKEGDFPIAESVGDQVLTLPLYPEFSEADQNQVCDCIKTFFEVM